MELKSLLDAMHAAEAWDLHLVAGQPPTVRVGGSLQRLEVAALQSSEIDQMVLPYLTGREAALIDQGADIDRILRFEGRAYRAHVFQERNQLASTIRAIAPRVPTLDELYETGSVAARLKSLITRKNGLIIVTGYTLSGKATTLAAMIEAINTTQATRIVTLEDPIQYEYESKESLITQRSIGSDVASYREGVRAVFREDADVVLIDEMHDLETLSLALSLADTGRLVLMPVHCKHAVEAIYRLTEVFPEPRGHVRRLLARNLLGVIAQAILPRSDRPGRVAVNEVLLPTPEIRQMIADGSQETDLALAAGRLEEMQFMDDGIIELFRSGTISEETARAHMDDPARLTA